MSKPVSRLPRNGAQRHDVKQQSSEEGGGLTVFAAECSCGWQTEATAAALVMFRVRGNVKLIWPRGDRIPTAAAVPEWQATLDAPPEA